MLEFAYVTCFKCRHLANNGGNMTLNAKDANSSFEKGVHIDDCASSPCQNGGSCTDMVNGYDCSCLPDLYEGPHCETLLRGRLYPHGPLHEDVTLDWDSPGLNCDAAGKKCHSGFIKTPRIKIYSSEFTNIKIYSNGYITMGQSYNRRMPADFSTVSNSKKWSGYYRGFAMFAPLWTDAKFHAGQVTYHIYDRTDTKVTETEKYRVKHALQLAREDTVNYGGSSSISPSWVMVITWVDSTPRMYYSDYFEQPNTFQLVLIYDPARWITSVMFLYEKTGWDRYWMVRDSQIGFYVTENGREDSRALAQSGKSSAFEMAEIVGNTVAISVSQGLCPDQSLMPSFRSHTNQQVCTSEVEVNQQVCTCEEEVNQQVCTCEEEVNQQVCTCEEEVNQQVCTCEEEVNQQVCTCEEEVNQQVCTCEEEVNQQVCTCEEEVNQQGYLWGGGGHVFGGGFFLGGGGPVCTCEEEVNQQVCTCEEEVNQQVCTCEEEVNQQVCTWKIGKFYFSVSAGDSSPNYDLKCRNWFWEQRSYWWLVVWGWAYTRVCPCDQRRVLTDRRWKFDINEFRNSNGERECFFERRPWWISTQQCCYEYGSLIGRRDGTGGQTFFLHPRYGRAHVDADVKPKDWCCDKSDNCDIFYEARPLDTCWGYVPPFLAWFFGDPHIHTLDNFEYTFNGLGEYTLIETNGGNFTLQGRTAKAINENGTETNATVFSAFAAKDTDSDRVYIAMNGQRDGFTITVGLNESQLSVTVAAPDDYLNETKGLLGVFNKDPSDDLTPADGSTPLNISTATEKTIFFKFGETWRIDMISSLFYYPAGSDYNTFNIKNFTPLFLEDVLGNMTAAQRTEAEKTCGKNKECLFDFALTGNAAAAASGLETNTKNTETSDMLANENPHISVTSSFNVTVSVESSLTVVTTDPENDTVTLTLRTDLPSGATFDSQSGVFTWTPDDTTPVNISFKAVDEKGAIAPSADITVNLCDCSGHGECMFGELREGEKATARFRLVACNCTVGWTGESCDKDFDGCGDSPCTAGTNCTDLTPEEEAAQGTSFTCSECPGGYEDNDGVCVDVNECDKNSPLHACGQRCINKEPGFVNPGPRFLCDCYQGYRLSGDGKNCADVDECEERSSGCEQVCTNDIGNFTCSCYGGYQLNSDNKTCDQQTRIPHGCLYPRNSLWVLYQNSLWVLYQNSPLVLYQNSPLVLYQNSTWVLYQNSLLVLYQNSPLVLYQNSTWVLYQNSPWVLYQNSPLVLYQNSPWVLYQNSTWVLYQNSPWVLYQNSLWVLYQNSLWVLYQNSPWVLYQNSLWVLYQNSPWVLYQNSLWVLYQNSLWVLYQNSHSDCGYGCRPDSGATLCFCPIGKTLATDNKTCEDENECLKNDTNTCEHSCHNLDGGYNCSCNDGYTLNADLRTCKPCPDGKWGPQCSRLCNCDTPTTNCTPNAGCTKCPPGVTGGDCYEDLDECLNNPCGSNASCSNTIGTFHCDCHEGYVQQNLTSCVELDECESDPCQNGATCTDQFNNYVCSCVQGYSGRNCEIDVDECESSPCQNHGTCVDRVNKYRCSCPTGFTGSKCETALLCNSAPCQNGAVCVQGPASYSCSCLDGFNGKFCENNKSTLDYKNLKAKVIKALSDALSKTLSGRFVIVDVSFRQGSVVVDYQVAVDKDLTNPSLSIVAAIRDESNGGQFGEFEVDLSSISADVTTTKYHAQFRITSQEYTAELADLNSTEYLRLAYDVNTVLEVVYKEAFANDFVDIKNNTFSKGSIVSDYEVWLNVNSTDSTVQKVLDGLCL
ncbi:hypothetical protein LSAT2_018833 [Lamellibrachia satsuma]|nr:hypothetical protein LSAT2_018833 [Lamellibrachia satsuma]